MGVPLFSSPEAAVCCACGLQGDIHGDHLLSCPDMGRHARHNSLRDAVVHIAEAAGIDCRVEARLSQDSMLRPGDVMLCGFSRGRNLMADISVVNELQLLADFMLPCGSVSARRRAQKRDLYAVACAREGLEFEAIVANTCCGWEPAAVDFLRGLFRRYRVHNGGSPAEVYPALWGRVSVGLAACIGRQLAQGVLGSLPCEY